MEENQSKLNGESPSKRRKKTSWPQIRKYLTRTGDVRWQVDTRINERGRMVGSRESFETEGEAKSAAQIARIKRRNDGSSIFDLEERHRADAKRALERYQSWLMERQRQWSGTLDENLAARLTASAADRFSLDAAVEAFLPQLAVSMETQQKSVSNCTNELINLKTRSGRSGRYLLDMKNRLERFGEDFGERPICEISTAVIDSWLAELKVGERGRAGSSRDHLASATTRNNYRRILRVLFGFAMSRNYCFHNPVPDTEQAKEVSGEIGILSVRQTAKLMKVARPDILPSLAIGAFAGLRRAEIERLDWGEVDLHDLLIEVTAPNAKSARRRLVKVSANLEAWLLPHLKVRGSVAPPNFSRRLVETRKEAGITTWPDNALRHGFASYHLAEHSDAAALALEMGHTTAQQIFDNYRQLVRPKAAKSYWAIRPDI